MSAARVGPAIALGLLLSHAAVAAKTDVYALQGARVLTVSGAPVEGATVVLRDGLIEAVGAGVAAPPEARVIDAKGLTLTPGLIDAFGGTGLPAPPARRPGGGSPAGSPTPAAATASGLTPQASALDRVAVADALRARDSGVTTALVVPRGGVLPGRSVLLNLSGDKAEGMVLRQPAAFHLHLATLGRQYPGSLMGTVALARQQLWNARRYRDEWAAYERAPRGRKRPAYDPGLVAWQDVLSGALPLMVTASRENDVPRALALADEFKVKVVVAGAPQAFRSAELIKSRRVPLIVSVNFDPPRAAGGFFGGGPDEEKEKQDVEEAERNPAELHRAGVAFALASAHAPSFLAGVQKAIERGLPREAALRAVTLAAAEALGVADRLGSLEAGKIANVVAWTAEPLTKEAKVKMVFVDGQLYEPEERPEPARGEGRRPAEVSR
jgi:imidazolonepropionase-like amidohydrolase